MLQKLFSLTYNVFYVTLGESVDDCGGGYSESVAEMCDELQQQHPSPCLPLLIPTPNGREEAGTSRDCLVLNPSLLVESGGGQAAHHTHMFRSVQKEGFLFTASIAV